LASVYCLLRNSGKNAQATQGTINVDKSHFSSKLSEAISITDAVQINNCKIYVCCKFSRNQPTGVCFNHFGM